MSLNPNTFIEFNSLFHVIPEDSNILIAFSGGVDSVVLTHLLFNSKQYFKIRSLALCYVNHHLRSDVEQDIAFAENFADRFGIPLFVEDVYPEQFAQKHNQSLEESARLLRYEVLEKVAGKHGYDCIATAHHKTDLAETLLQRIMEGTGIQGLTGIALHKGKIIRPLLFFTRNEIESYTIEEKLSFRKDYSNDDLRFKRNKIRHQLLPFIRDQFNNNIEEALFRLAMNAVEWQEYVQREITACSRILMPEVIRIDRRKLSGYPPFIKKMVIEDALNQVETGFFVTFNKWKQLNRQLDSDSGNFRFKNTIRIGWDKHAIWIYREANKYSYQLTEGEFSLPFNLKLSVTKTQITDLNIIHRLSGGTSGKKWKPFDKILVSKSNLAGELIIGSPAREDSFQPLGSDYKVNVMRYLKEKGIPEPLIRFWPVIRMQNNVVIALPGLMPAEPWKVAREGEEVLEIKIFNFEKFFV